jgi:hypothetical protein
MASLSGRISMNKWGQNMVNGCFTVAEMCAVGLGIAEGYLYEEDGEGAALAGTHGK